MLRAIFQQPPRKNRGRLAEAFELMHAFADGRTRPAPGATEVSGRAFRLVLWTRSMIITLDELEQSLYCATMYAQQIKHRTFQEMTTAEYDDYRRHLYYYRNAVLRVFASLDKLGSFLDERYTLHTERIKQRFSYFTVLRRMREIKQAPELLRRLQTIKDMYDTPMQDLRQMRNHEVHGMNSEMLDDEGRIRCYSTDCLDTIEDLQQNLQTLNLGFDMVCKSVIGVYQQKYLLFPHD
jgi:hypothetical protein